MNTPWPFNYPLNGWQIIVQPNGDLQASKEGQVYQLEVDFENLKPLEKWTLERVSQDEESVQMFIAFLNGAYTDGLLRKRSEALLKEPDFFDKLDQELGKQIEGENKARRAIALFCCIAYVKNRGKGACNNLLINADSSAGKDYVTRAITDLFPQEKVESLSRASGRAFTYWKANDPKWTWDGKICRLTDIPNELLNSDSFKTFLSDGEKAVIVNKDKKGVTDSFEYQVTGKPVLLATTAEANPNNEMLNRFNILFLDESSQQTRAITRRRLKEAAGEQDDAPKYSQIVIDALKSLQLVKVVIPYAKLLEQYLPDDIRARRDVPRILNLIKASAAIHQQQRERMSTGEVVANERDYELAREALQVIQTGQFVSITRNLRKAFETAQEFAKERGTRFSAPELHAFKPACSERQLYRYLDQLAEKRLLNTQLEKREESSKKVLTYAPESIGLTSIVLPKFNDLGLSIASVVSSGNHTNQLSIASVVSDGRYSNEAIDRTDTTDKSNTQTTVITDRIDMTKTERELIHQNLKLLLGRWRDSDTVSRQDLLSALSCHGSDQVSAALSWAQSFGGLCEVSPDHFRVDYSKFGGDTNGG